jgi:tryptophan synthase alpha chain
MGVTGARESMGDAAQVVVRRTKAVTDKPVCVGLGVSNGGQAAEVAAYADGVIVGSALVRCLTDAADEAAGLTTLRTLVEELADGVRRGR